MSIVLENIITWAPWGLGMAGAGATAYYANRFPSADLDTARGTVVGTTGNVLFGLSAANLAVQSWAIIEWLKYIAKMKEGKLSSQNRNRTYGRTMIWFWWLMLLFYVVIIVSAALDVHLVTNYGNVNASVSSSKLGGSYGDAVEGLSYTGLAVGGIAFFVYVAAELFTRKLDDPHPTFLESHGGDR